MYFVQKNDNILWKMIQDKNGDDISKKILSIQDRCFQYYNLYKLPEMKYQLIHGDIHPQNILKSKNSLYIIDFDNISYFPASYEILRFYFELISNDLNNNQNIEILNVLLKSYNDYHPLDNKEWDNSLYFYISILLKDISMINNYEFISKRILRAQFILDNQFIIENTIKTSTRLGDFFNEIKI
ncbi:hypothetical protein CW681_11330 [Macrococcoides caseolyticum]|nr:hypothetical protein CW692_11905 [Macrococcus caseolyticus]PKE22880.1 hypothetical protein CW689_12145 [Macrococcus caseolyticus]PKF37596.1 hypothetical protein CW681_11330 [Macrococcus caseolyticus]